MSELNCFMELALCTAHLGRLVMQNRLDYQGLRTVTSRGLFTPLPNLSASVHQIELLAQCSGIGLSRGHSCTFSRRVRMGFVAVTRVEPLDHNH